MNDDGEPRDVAISVPERTDYRGVVWRQALRAPQHSLESQPPCQMCIVQAARFWIPFSNYLLVFRSVFVTFLSTCFR